MKCRVDAVPVLMRPTARRLGLLLALTLLVGCDHATKLAAKAGLEGHRARPLIHGVLDLRYVENTDVAFNLLRTMPETVRAPLLVVVGAVAGLFLLGLLLVKRGDLGGARVALLFVTAGALGNYLDRVGRGYVVDFIHVPHWPVFNVADAYVTVGVVVLAWYALKARHTPATE